MTVCARCGEGFHPEDKPGYVAHWGVVHTSWVVCIVNLRARAEAAESKMRQYQTAVNEAIKSGRDYAEFWKDLETTEDTS